MFRSGGPRGAPAYRSYVVQRTRRLLGAEVRISRDVITHFAVT
jgi:hypothetical protein